MGKLQQEEAILNEGDELRALIGQCEKDLASITPDSARQLMRNATAADALLDRLAASGTDVRAEASRMSTIGDRIVNSAKPIVAAIGGEPAFAALRAQAKPGATEQWWRLDDVLAARRRRTWQRVGIAAAIVVLIGVAGFLLRGWLFPPDPIGDAVFGVQAALRDGDVSRALNAVELGLTESPTSTTLLIWKGVLLDEQGDSAAADAYRTARANVTENQFLLERSQANLMMGNFDQVVADTTAVIDAQPDSAEAYFVRASGHEGRNEVDMAIRDLEAASRIAQSVGNDTLFATARVRLGLLVQNSAGRPQQP
jgi:hypothetical protein